jgi:hypothetical protein
MQSAEIPSGSRSPIVCALPEKRIERRSVETSNLGLPDGRWTAHDLRRTAATLMTKLGISGDVIDECLDRVIEVRGLRTYRTYIRDRRWQVRLTLSTRQVRS